VATIYSATFDEMAQVPDGTVKAEKYASGAPLAKARGRALHRFGKVRPLGFGKETAPLAKARGSALHRFGKETAPLAEARGSALPRFGKEAARDGA
jgi:hypothetical protein